MAENLLYLTKSILWRIPENKCKIKAPILCEFWIKPFFESSYFELASEMVMFNNHSKSLEILKYICNFARSFKIFTAIMSLTNKCSTPRKHESKRNITANA